MAQHSLTYLCIILCAAQVAPLPISCRIHGGLIQNIQSLLEKMGGLFPLECLDHNARFTFPVSSFKSNTTAQVDTGVERAVYATLVNIDVLYENDTMPTNWDQVELDIFRNLVYRVVEESECVLKKSQTVQEDTFSDSEAALEEYFGEMTNFLEEKEYSVCAWEVVRKETLHALRFILHDVSDPWA
ncbi:interferon alpha-4-like [Engraulis encrasicolus]|uniref:interferon alpha-4-like n=1 Tax=Engraulis encrasicolus TaxID=184585 RepID=UPI002FD11D75